MKKLLLLSATLIFACSSDDSNDNPVPAHTVEGKWLWSPTDTFWNSLDSSDRIPGTDSYTYDGYSLIIDGIQEMVSFECDGGIMLFENGGQYWRLSSDCN